MKRAASMLVLGGLLSYPVTGIFAQRSTNPNPTQTSIYEDAHVPILKVHVVERTAKAINYRHRSGSTTIDFRGTPLLAHARGEAKVESKQGYIEIEVEFDDLSPATQFGPEFLTYVMWAITPEGRAMNLGEVILNGTKSKLDVTTELQSFALIVTAEPYFAVSQPSDVVVMENEVRKDTVGRIEQVDARYELLQRGEYTLNILPADMKPLSPDKRVSLDLLEARNAVRIAQWAGANQYAADTLQKARNQLDQAENYKQRKAGKTTIAMVSRQAAQTAEDARLIAMRRQDEERQAEEHRQSELREAAAKAKAEQEARLRSQAQTQEAEARLRAERAQEEAAEAEARAREARVAAAADVEQARQQALKAEQEKAALRAQLMDQLNLILETRDSARGLIVNLSDVLFDFGKYTLRPEAREKLAKISGIILAHPGLYLEVEGHTDDVGSDDYNQKLSEQRANAVKAYLVKQGVASVSARGFGESWPAVPNDSEAHRQINRRVEMIVSGDVIGSPLTSRLRPQ
jgi:outer membrane protein OmpA-like peptidoglycan-associated protein